MTVEKRQTFVRHLMFVDGGESPGCSVSSASGFSPTPQALEKDVSDHLKSGPAMSDKLKNKEEEVRKVLNTLDAEVKRR